MPKIAFLAIGLVLGFIFGLIVGKLRTFGTVHIAKQPAEGEMGFLFEFNDNPEAMKGFRTVMFDVKLEDQIEAPK